MPGTTAGRGVRSLADTRLHSPFPSGRGTRQKRPEHAQDVSRLPLSASLAFSDLTEEMLDCGPGAFVHELEELRAENDYLKENLWPSTAKRGRNTVTSLYPGLSQCGTVPACLPGRIHFERMTSGNIPLAAVHFRPV
ncbi:hypothetical protein TREES_T100008584 [Tupaia chinensis]|uniref:Uncharacterized protein n=1 Tax=Tupaia chinensis TaxID=246437 RepID=L9L7E4_TUPCH|nr:hypothetical protein TREES_T100008584 [Tupaia chinensis]